MKYPIEGYDAFLDDELRVHRILNGREKVYPFDPDKRYRLYQSDSQRISSVLGRNLILNVKNKEIKKLGLEINNAQMISQYGEDITFKYKGYKVSCADRAERIKREMSGIDRFEKVQEPVSGGIVLVDIKTCDVVKRYSSVRQIAEEYNLSFEEIDKELDKRELYQGKYRFYKFGITYNNK